MTNIQFSFSDLVAGYISSIDATNQQFTICTTDDRFIPVKVAVNCAGEVMRNLGEAYLDCTPQIGSMLIEGRYVYAYGVYYTDSNVFEAKHIVFVGRDASEYRFEKQDWWVKQIDELAKFYLHAQFGDGDIDYRNYRTNLTLEGQHTANNRQETDTISRLVYGFATAYMMTGNERYLEAAEKGADYLIEHLCVVNKDEQTAFWYHALDLVDGKEKKIFASEFGDDYNAIPAYEQIYALAGIAQTYRVTGNPKLLTIIDQTINLFDRYFLDRERGGYFSHIDPIMFDPRSESLGHNRARKNWNSVGDHAPAYLINVLLATGEERYRQMLQQTAETIVARFPDDEHSPFVQERFFEDWTRDEEWGWQQNRAVVGHNLKIAWNLMRMNNAIDSETYRPLAEKIADNMPRVGSDRQRGGWYDVVERTLAPNETEYRFAWHDRKAWWQQEQAILAYSILAGTLTSETYLQHAREAASFYNAWFLDHESGGVYFNVLANGMPYVLGTERGKGSHSMSGYHSFELAYLATVYTNLLVTKQPMTLHFRPNPATLPNQVLRVSPDLLPANTVKIADVTINGRRYDQFDATALTVQLPNVNERLTIVVTLMAVSGAEHLSAALEVSAQTSRLILDGEIDNRSASTLRTSLAEWVESTPVGAMIDLTNVRAIDEAGIRTIVFESQKLSSDRRLTIIGANETIRQQFIAAHFDQTATFVDRLSTVS